MSNEYKSYFRPVGTSPYVCGTNGAPELHAVLGEFAFCKAMRYANTASGNKEVLDTTLFIKGQTQEIQKFFPLAPVMDDGTIAVNCSFWGEDAKKIDAEAYKADQAGAKRNVRVAAVGYLYLDEYQKDGQQKTSLKFNSQWLASAKAKQPKQNQGYGYQDQQYGQSAPQYGQPAPQYGQSAPQYSQPAPQYGQPAPQYSQPAPQYGQSAPQYGQPPMQPAPAQQPPQGYTQPAPAPAPASAPTQQAPQYRQSAPVQQPPQGYTQPAPVQPQYGQQQGYNQPAPAPAQQTDFAIIEDNDGELPF